jgi:hypothetical protein
VTVLPDNILRAMEPKERAKLGKAGMLASEAAAKQLAKREKDVQKHICNWLRQKDIFFFWSRTDRRTTTQIGTPDFAFICSVYKMSSDSRGRVMPCAVEVKVGGNKLSPEQEKVRKQMIGDGWNYFVVDSLGLMIEQIMDDKYMPAERSVYRLITPL